MAEICFDKYIDNPSGQSSVITNRSMFKNLYKQKFDAVLLREQGKINYTVYHAKDKTDSYYIHMKIPSEVVPEFYYDVVVQLYTTDNSKKVGNSLRGYGVRFFSNDPAFYYTFLYAFNKNDMFIKDLKSKASGAFKTPAKEKNPKNNVWYVKSLYFAYLTMEKYSLFNRAVLNQKAIRYVKNTLLNNITQAEVKIQQRQSEADKLRRQRNEEKLRKEQEKPKYITKNSPPSKFSKTVNSTKSTKKTKIIKGKKPK